MAGIDFSDLVPKTAPAAAVDPNADHLYADIKVPVQGAAPGPVPVPATPAAPGSAIDFSDLVPGGASAQPAAVAAPAAAYGALPETVGGSSGVAPLRSDGTIADFIKGQIATAPEQIADSARLLGKGATLGYSDKLLSALTGSPLADEQAADSAAMARSGVAGDILEGLGTVAPVSAFGKVLAGVGAAADGVPIIGRILGSPLAQATATGAGTGAAQANSQGKDAAEGAITGALAAPVAAGLGSTVGGALGKVAGVVNKKVAAPTLDWLKGAAQDAYDRSEKAGAIVNPGAISRLATNIHDEMANFGWAPELQPGAGGVLRNLGRMLQNPGSSAPTNVTLKGLDVLRRTASAMTGNVANKSEQALGHRIVGVIDNFVNTLHPTNDILPGAGPDAIPALQEARGYWARYAKGNKLAQALDRADLGAGAVGSGGNINNATRQKVKQLVLKGGFTPDEQAALRAVVKGTPLANAARLIGKGSPEGNGIGLMAHTAAALHTGGASLPLAAVGFSAKRLGDHLTERAVQNAANVIQNGGVSLTPRNVVQRAITRATPAARSALMSLFLDKSAPGASK